MIVDNQYEIRYIAKKLERSGVITIPETKQNIIQSLLLRKYAYLVPRLMINCYYISIALFFVAFSVIIVLNKIGHLEASGMVLELYCASVVGDAGWIRYYLRGSHNLRDEYKLDENGRLVSVDSSEGKSSEKVEDEAEVEEKDEVD